MTLHTLWHSACKASTAACIAAPSGPYSGLMTTSAPDPCRLAGGEHLSPAEIVTIVRAAVRSQDRIAFTWFFPFAPLSLPGVAAQLMEELLAARDTTGMEVFLTTSAGAALAQSAAGSWAVTRAIEDGDTPTAGLLLDHGARLAPSMRVLRDHVVTAVTRDASALVKLRRLLQHGYRPGLEQAPGSAEQPLWLSDMEVDANTDSWGVSQSDTPCPIHFLLAMAHARLSLWSKTYVVSTPAWRGGSLDVRYSHGQQYYAAMGISLIPCICTPTLGFWCLPRGNGQSPPV